MDAVVITGVGLVTPLGLSPSGVVDGILRGELARWTPPSAGALACPLLAPVADFDAGHYFPENKSLRMMSRDAQMAVVAAQLAMRDARVVPGATYAPEEIAVFGSTGLSGMATEETMRLVQSAAAPDGSLDLARFGRVGLKRIRPVLSFKILANMPICFVSIFENVRGPNAVYTPWEGQGAQAIASGIRAIRRGDVPCALVGGCDVKTYELSLLSLQQLGVLDSWARYGRGCIPGEGAAFLVLEREDLAVRRSARVYARVRDYAFRSTAAQGDLARAVGDVIASLTLAGRPLVISAADGNPLVSEAEDAALRSAGIDPTRTLSPKVHLGNTFAAAAAVQVGLGAEVAARQKAPCSVLADCFGHGTEQAAFVLEAV